MHHYVTSVFSCVLPAHLLTRVTAVTARLLWEIRRLLSHLSKCSWLLQLPGMFLISTPSRSTSFDNEAAHSICLKGVRPMFGCKACCGGQRNAYRCTRQGDARLDLLFFFLILFLPPALLANSLPSMDDVKQREYKEMCIYVWVRCCTCFCVRVSTLSPFLYALLPPHIKTPAWKRADGMLAQALNTWMRIKWVRKVRLVCSAVCWRHVFVCVCVTGWWWWWWLDLLQRQQ